MRKILPLLFLFSACAVVVHPSGGDKDETPPKALEIFPDSNTTSFDGNEIRIYFDEYFEIQDPNAILISPPPKKAPKIEVVKKYLSIRFKEALRDDATYTIQLFDAIKDINEGNVLPALQFSFSTGEQLDTMAFRGIVKENISDKPQKAYTVALFHADILSYPDSLRYPLYITKTLENGSFYLPSVSQDTFSVYAFNDINNNKILDPGEEMGYLGIPQYPNDSIEIRTGKSVLNKPLIFSSPKSISSNAFYLPLTLPEDYPLSIVSDQKSFDKTQKLHYQFIHQDTLLVQDFIKSNQDSLVHYYLMKGDTITDTLTVTYNTLPNSISLHPSAKNTLAPIDTFTLVSRNAIASSRPGYYHLLESDSIPIEGYKMMHDFWKIRFTWNLEHDKDYTLILKDSAFRFLDGQFSTADTFQFRTSNSNRYGDAAVLFSNPDNDLYSIQLLSDLDKEPEYEISSNSDSVYFRSLAPGQYFVRLLLIDSIQRPDRLIPFQQQLSKVYVNPTKLTVRGGWTIGDFLLHNEED